MTEFFAQPDDVGDIRASELHGSMLERLEAQGGEAFMSGTRTLGRLFQYSGAEGIAAMTSDAAADPAVQEQLEQQRRDLPSLSIADAQTRIKDEGLEHHVKLPQQPDIKQGVLDLMIAHGHERRQYEAAVSRAPGLVPDALGFVTEMGLGIIDPVNMAAFSVPVIGEARYGHMLAAAGDSVAARAGVNALVGAGQGAVGSAAIAPADWWLHSRDGQDYTMADALRSVVLGAGMGAGFHAGIGAFRDMRARAAGAPLAGSPADLVERGLMGGTHVHGSALAEAGVPAEDVPGLSLPPPLTHPADVLADLPPRVRENVTQAAMADVIADRPVRAGEMLDIAARQDPRIAESIEAWHGSPHDFEAFDISKIGTGEGAASFGHGLYFAEREAVAKSYRDQLGDAKVDGQRYDVNNPLHAAVGLVEEFGSREAALAEARGRQARDIGDFYERVARHLESGKALPAVETKAFLYKVRIKANPEHMLDWDKPLSEQSEHVRSVLKQLGVPDKPIIGGGAYQFLNHKASFDGGTGGSGAATEALRQAGIPGIKYLDQGSRPTPERIAAMQKFVDLYREDLQKYPDDVHIRRALEEAERDVQALRDRENTATSNFVVFNDADVEITHKNGEPVTREEIAAAHRSADVLPGPPAAKGPRARDESTYSLNEFLARKGGLAPHPDVAAIFGGKNKFVPGFGNLIRRTGMSLDRAREAAVEAGYLHDAAQEHGGVTESTINHLLEAVDAEARGTKQYRAGSEPEAKRNREQDRVDMERELDGALEEVGVKPSEVSGKLRDRVLQIMEREGVSDPLVAHERAVMEETQRVADSKATERIPDHIPGWDVPDDAGAASGAGRPARPELVAGREGPRPAASAARPGDRGADAWRKLADQRDPDAANDLAESRAAAETPELASADAVKAPSAAEKAAAEADKLLEDIKSKLTEAERARFDEVLAALSQDKEARDQVVRDGAACLLEAAG